MELEKQLKNKRKNRLIIAVAAIAIVLAVVGCVFGFVWSMREKSTSTQPVETNQQKAITDPNEITGTAAIEGNDIRLVAASVTGTVVSANFEEGDTVQAGDILYRIDTKDINDAIAKAQLGLEKARLSKNTLADDIRKLNITAPISGTVTAVYVNHGDSVTANAKIAEVIDDSNMTLKVPFIDTDADQLSVGQSADVSMVGTSYAMTGTVTRVGSGHGVSASGNSVRMVEVTVANPGALKDGDKGTAVIGGIACNDAGEFEASGSETIIAQAAGQVESLPIKEGDHVNAGVQVASLKNDALVNNQKQNELSVRDALLALNMQKEQLSKYVVKAPISGVVTKKTVKAGDTLSAANMAGMATIVDTSRTIFKLKVDELDVTKITMGQKVEFTADSMGDTVYTGTVDYIDTISAPDAGAASGQAAAMAAGGAPVGSGAVLYPVTVVVDDPYGLYTGMTVNAKILTGTQPTPAPDGAIADGEGAMQ